MPGKILTYTCLLPGCAAAGYLYLVRVLRPVRPAIACPPGQLHHWPCASDELIVSTPFFVIAGALIGTWLAYALVRLYAGPRRRSVTLRECLVAAPLVLGITAWIIALHPDTAWAWGSVRSVLLFVLAAALARLAIGVASIAEVRRGLTLALGMPVIFSGLGYAFIATFRQPPVGHSCPALAPASACVYHPLIGESGPWIILGLLAGMWLAYAVAADLATSPRQVLIWAECAIVLPALTAVTLWALVIGPEQAGGGYVGLFVLAVGLTAILRLLLAARSVKKQMPGMFAKLGMVRRPEAAV
jgi:hypothetical protein